MVKLADTVALGATAKACRFESCQGHFGEITLENTVKSVMNLDQ